MCLQILSNATSTNVDSHIGVKSAYLGYSVDTENNSDTSTINTQTQGISVVVPSCILQSSLSKNVEVVSFFFFFFFFPSRFPSVCSNLVSQVISTKYIQLLRPCNRSYRFVHLHQVMKVTTDDPVLK